jgi:hypothetical protein
MHLQARFCHFSTFLTKDGAPDGHGVHLVPPLGILCLTLGGDFGVDVIAIRH